MVIECFCYLPVEMISLPILLSDQFGIDELSASSRQSGKSQQQLPTQRSVGVVAAPDDRLLFKDQGSRRHGRGAGILCCCTDGYCGHVQREIWSIAGRV